MKINNHHHHHHQKKKKNCQLWGSSVRKQPNYRITDVVKETKTNPMKPMCL